jgi:hypothetical protein
MRRRDGWPADAGRRRTGYDEDLSPIIWSDVGCVMA